MRCLFSFSCNIYMLLFLLFLLLQSCKKSQGTYPEVDDSLLTYAPRNTNMIVNIPDVHQLDEDLELPVLKSSFGDLFHKNTIDELLTVPVDELPDKGVFFFFEEGRKYHAFTYVHKATDDFNRLVVQNTSNFESSTYNDIVYYKSKKGSVYIHLDRGMVFYTNSKLFLESLIREHSGHWTKSANFTRIAKGIDQNASISLLLNTQEVPKIYQWLSHLNNSLSITSKENWLGLDFFIEQNKVSISGVYAPYSQEWIYSVVSQLGRDVKLNELLSVISSKVSELFMVNYSSDTVNRLQDIFSIWDQHDSTSLVPKGLEKTTNLMQFQLPNAKGLAFVINENFVLKEAFSLEEEDVVSGVKVFKIKKPSDVILDLLEASSDVQPCVFIYDSKVCILPTLSLAKNLILQLKQKNLFAQTHTGEIFQDQMLTSSALFYYTDGIRLFDKLNKHLKKKYKLSYGFTQDTLSNAFVQLYKQDDLVYIQGQYQLVDLPKESKFSISQTASLKLDTDIAGVPKFVKNHRSGGYDIVVQDQDNNLYLISDKGKVFWKKPLDGKILGEIKQIDLLNNNRLQLFLNTANTLYVIDRNGKDVNPYPLHFKKPVSVGVALFDYENNRDYRVLVAQDDHLILFNKNLQRLQDFQAELTKTPIVLTPKHIRIKGKDYILVQEKSGRMHILNRRGKERIEMKRKYNSRQSDWFLYHDTFAHIDNLSNIVQVNQQGDILHKIISPTPFQYEFSDNHLVAITDHVLLYDDRQVSIPYGNYTDIQLHKSSSVITLLDQVNQKIIAYDANTLKPILGFPIYGTSKLSLSRKSKRSKVFQLVTKGQSNELIVYDFTKLIR